MSERQLGEQFPGNETFDAADGWIAHDGNGMPVDGPTKVKVRFRDGKEDPGSPWSAAQWGANWSHHPPCDADIVAYRVVEA